MGANSKLGKVQDLALEGANIAGAAAWLACNCPLACMAPILVLSGTFFCRRCRGSELNGTKSCLCPFCSRFDAVDKHASLQACVSSEANRAESANEFPKIWPIRPCSSTLVATASRWNSAIDTSTPGSLQATALVQDRILASNQGATNVLAACMDTTAHVRKGG
jgi:hypothetical protein